MVKTLLLTFIHGFKGDEETFFEFPSELKKAISASEPNLNIETAVYPKYETKGDLSACVATFRKWLEEQVSDLERITELPPSENEKDSERQMEEKLEEEKSDIGVILIAHSMGGFVAADTLFSVLDSKQGNQDSTTISGKQPQILGLLCFDTPFNGLARSMFAYGAFSQYQNLSSIWNVVSTLSSGLSTSSAMTAASSASGMARWQALAARTGTVGAIMAGGVAAYIHREQIYAGWQTLRAPETREKLTIAELKKIDYAGQMREGVASGLTYVSRDSIGEGFAWMAGHLKFVGALMKTEEMGMRLERLQMTVTGDDDGKGVGVRNLYTSMGENGVWNGGYFVPKRTFCAVPTDKSVKAPALPASTEKGSKDTKKTPETVEDKEKNLTEKEKTTTETAKNNEKVQEVPKAEGMWQETPNPLATNEIEAHCSMFRSEKNSSYSQMLSSTTATIISWKDNDPSQIKEHWKPKREQLVRCESQNKLWDDDGKVLSPTVSRALNAEHEGIAEEAEKEDDMQLDAILKSSELPVSEDGVDETSLEAARSIPLPVDEGVVEAEGQLGDVDEMKKSWYGSVVGALPNVSVPSFGKGEKGEVKGWYGSVLGAVPTSFPVFASKKTEEDSAKAHAGVEKKEDRVDAKGPEVKEQPKGWMSSVAGAVPAYLPASLTSKKSSKIEETKKEKEIAEENIVEDKAIGNTDTDKEHTESSTQESTRENTGAAETSETSHAFTKTETEAKDFKPEHEAVQEDTPSKDTESKSTVLDAPEEEISKSENLAHPDTTKEEADPAVQESESKPPLPARPQEKASDSEKAKDTSSTKGWYSSLPSSIPRSIPNLPSFSSSRKVGDEKSTSKETEKTDDGAVDGVLKRDGQSKGWYNSVASSIPSVPFRKV